MREYSSSRRNFIKSAAVIAAAANSRPLLAGSPYNAESLPSIEDSRVRQLTMSGLDTARSAGADYADVRLSHVKDRTIQGSMDVKWSDTETMTAGVKALVNGYWGFASSPVWDDAEIVRLSEAAVRLAKLGAQGARREVNLASIPELPNGHWDMPIEINPFEVSRDEIADFLVALVHYSTRFRGLVLAGPWNCRFVLTEKSFGSTEGAYCTQRLFHTTGNFAWGYRGRYSGMAASLNRYLSVAGAGWEQFKKQPLREAIRQMYAELSEDTSIPVKPVDIGRYDALFDVETTVGFISSTIGAASELDRILGYEANATGTSYLSGSTRSSSSDFLVGSQSISVTADRTMHRGAANVRWDDEGVTPQTFPIIQNGQLINYITTRESAKWLSGNPLQSSASSKGCSAAPHAVDLPLSHVPNLKLSPSATSDTFDSMTKSMESGVMVKRGSFDMDFQQLNGYGEGVVFEVKNGKRVAAFANASMLIRAPEFWNGVIQFGGKDSVMRYGMFRTKGEPPQQMPHSVESVPMVVKDVTFIDAQRKA